MRLISTLYGYEPLSLCISSNLPLSISVSIGLFGDQDSWLFTEYRWCYMAWQFRNILPDLKEWYLRAMGWVLAIHQHGNVNAVFCSKILTELHMKWYDEGKKNWQAIYNCFASITMQDKTSDGNWWLKRKIRFKVWCSAATWTGRLLRIWESYVDK